MRVMADARRKRVCKHAHQLSLFHDAQSPACSPPRRALDAMDMDNSVPTDAGKPDTLRQRTTSLRSHQSHGRASSPRLHIFPDRTGTLVSQNPRCVRR